jgi:hypothetical protein
MRLLIKYNKIEVSKWLFEKLKKKFISFNHKKKKKRKQNSKFIFNNIVSILKKKKFINFYF